MVGDVGDLGQPQYHQCNQPQCHASATWIKECISTTTTSFLVNGSTTTKFSFQRGLRQRDRPSPFFFLIVADCLYVMMKVIVAKGLFTSYKVGDVEPK